MKRIIVLLSIISVAGSAYAMPAVDVSAGSMPFRLIQETLYEEQEMEDMNSRKEDMNFLRRLKKPARVDLQQTPTEFQRPAQPSNMELKEENGKIMIKSVQ